MKFQIPEEAKTDIEQIQNSFRMASASNEYLNALRVQLQYWINDIGWIQSMRERHGQDFRNKLNPEEIKCIPIFIDEGLLPTK